MPQIFTASQFMCYTQMCLLSNFKTQEFVGYMQYICDSTGKIMCGEKLRIKYVLQFYSISVIGGFVVESKSKNCMFFYV